MAYRFETFWDDEGIGGYPMSQTDFMSHESWEIGCVNYARFPKSDHINKACYYIIYVVLPHISTL